MTRPFANNPGFLDDEELIASFTVRKHDFDILVEQLRDEPSGTNQHILLIGPRGMGKTTLVRRLVAEVRDDDSLNDRWFPLVFSEELPSVLSVGELWLEAVRRLADVADTRRWSRIYDNLLEEGDEKRLRGRALEQLTVFAEEIDSKLLLVIENMNMLLGEQLSDDEAWTLRHTLLNEERLMVIGTATTRFEAIDNVEKAMFDLFKIHQLEPLNAEECRLLYESITGVRLEGRRVRPLQVWTGGNPRLVAIMASFARDSSVSGLMENLQQLVDDHTPYFKSNLEALSVLERKIYVTLAEQWNWSTARDVATRARIGVNKTSTYLGRLESRGAVESKKEGRAKKYRVSERLFILYHLMRSRGGEAERLQGLIEFMTDFYEPKSVLVRIAEDALEAGPEKQKEFVAEYQRLWKEADRRGARQRALIRTPPEFFRLEDISLELQSRHEVSLKDLRVRYSRIWRSSSTRWDDPDRLEQRERELLQDLRDPEHSPTRRRATLWQLSRIYRAQQRFEDALDVSYGALSEFPEFSGSWEALARTYAQKGDDELAIRAFEMAVSLHESLDDPIDYVPWNQYLSFLLNSGKPLEQVLEFAERYLRHRPDRVSIAWVVSESMRADIFPYVLEWLEQVEEKKRGDLYYCVQWFVVRQIGDFEQLLPAFRKALNGLHELISIEGMRGVLEDIARLIKLGPTEEIIDAIQSSPEAAILDPVVIALKCRSGQDVDVPREIREVAADVNNYFDEVLEN